jgi:cytosine/adenosine deaminase-related metal-dependent hydrolase
VGGGCEVEVGPPEILKTGLAGKVLLRGCVVTPDQAYTGEVLIDGDTLACVGPSCVAAPAAASATVVATHGIILPGMIDTHNHILFDIFDETDWAPTQSYANHNQWTKEARYSAMVDAKQYMNGEGTPNIDPGFGCEMDKYGELKGLIAGTTSIVGAANPGDKTCYGSLARTIDQKPNDLGQDKIQVSTLFPPSSGDTVCSNFAAGKTDAFVAHCGEGVDDTARLEFTKLGTSTTTQGCLYAPQTTLVHGAAFGDAEFSVMAQHGMSLVWSPRSNVFLYGGGVDMSRTTNVPLALQKGINVAIGPDWSIGGSQNLLDELRFADQVDNAVWGDVLSPKMLLQMVTVNAAKALGLSSMLGSLEAGKKADVAVIQGDATNPYGAVLAARPSDVRLVMVNGQALYGDSALQPLGPAAPGCEALEVCGAVKFVCVAETGGTTTNKLGQTLSDIQTILETQLEGYDAMNLSQWKFAPIAPLVKCQ